MHRRALLGGLAALSGFATALWAQTPAPAFDAELLEPLYAARASALALTLRVASTGCTTKADFAVHVDRSSALPAIALARKPVLACGLAKTSATPLDLVFTYEELGLIRGTSAQVLNPLAPAPMRAGAGASPRKGLNPKGGGRPRGRQRRDRPRSGKRSR